MVIKTEVDAFTEDRIYPGHGKRFVSRNGQLVIFGSSKTASMFVQKKRPLALAYTFAWRKAHKKVQTDMNAKRRVRGNKTQAVRGIVGMSAEEIRAKRAAKPSGAPKAAQKARARQ